MKRILLGLARMLVCIPLGIAIGAVGLAVLVRDLWVRR
jgi:hypothetical protein